MIFFFIQKIKTDLLLSSRNKKSIFNFNFPNSILKTSAYFIFDNDYLMNDNIFLKTLLNLCTTL